MLILKLLGILCPVIVIYIVQSAPKESIHLHQIQVLTSVRCSSIAPNSQMIALIIW